MMRLKLNGKMHPIACIEDAINIIDQFCDERDGVHGEPYKDENDVICIDIRWVGTGFGSHKEDDEEVPHVTGVKWHETIARIFTWSLCPACWSQSMIPLQPLKQSK